MFQYPRNQLDLPDAIKDTLGSFWAVLYGDRETVGTYCGAKATIEQQSINDLTEAANACSIRSCPVFHRVNWLPLDILQSQVTATSTGFRIPAPPLLSRINVICSHVTSPTTVWTTETDFALSGGFLTFQMNPFTAGFPVTPIYDQTGKQTDTQITLWLFHAYLDTSILYQQFGYIFNFNLSSSLNYKTLLIALWDALIIGTSRENLENALVALTDTPLAMADGERIVYVGRDKGDLLIVSDQNVYRYPANAQSLVEVDQVVQAGQPLTDVLRLESPLGPTLPLSSLSIGSGFLDSTINGSITFTDVDVPLQVSTAADGHTVVTFALDGDAAAITAFWNLIDQKGVASGTTLARAMDKRVNKIGEPVAANLPATVNPLRFLLQNVLRYNALLAIMRPEAFGPDAIGLSQFNIIRRMLSPHQAVVPVQLSFGSAGVIMDGLS
jgi:hypothetical protein